MSPLDSVVILDGAPVVGSDKADRLLKAIVKSATKEASISLNPSQIEMPTDASGNSKGFMFVSLENPTEANSFQRAMHGLAFDKRHTFSVVPFTEVDSFNDLQEEYQEPEEEEWAPRVSQYHTSPHPLAHFSFSLRRSTSVHGSPIPPVVINSSSTKVTTSELDGLARLELPKSLTSDPYVFAHLLDLFCAMSTDPLFNANRNGRISSRNGLLRVPTSRRFTFKVSPFGEEPRSNVSTDSPTPKSNLSISPLTNVTSSLGPLDLSRLLPTPR